MREFNLLELGREVLYLPQSIAVLGGHSRKIRKGRCVGLLKSKELSVGIALDNGLRGFGRGSGG